MLTLTIFLPIVTGLVVLLVPERAARWQRGIALAGVLATLACSLVLWAGYAPGGEPLQWRDRAAWIPQLGASYDVAVDGLGLPLILLVNVLAASVLVFVGDRPERTRAHRFLILAMQTGLLGVFAAQDLLLFYLFFEIALVPLYFLIGIWGHEGRRDAAYKFFLYTRVGSLAMLLGFLALYLGADPRTFSIPALAAAGAPVGGVAVFAFFAILLGLAVKLPLLPVHNWLPDAHVQAPTEGSVLLAGLLLKLGGFGLFRVLLPLLPETAARFGWVLIALGVLGIVYGALAALAQHDFKRLVAYTSINHMGFVAVAAGIAALAADPDTRSLALAGATFQMVSHGLLTGGMFFVVGMVEEGTGTRELDRMRGLLRRMPRTALLLGLLAFGSLGLPGLSGFVAEMQVIGSTLSVGWWLGVLAVSGVVVTTGLYLRVLARAYSPADARDAEVGDAAPRQTATVAFLAACSLLLGIVPAVLLSIIGASP